MSTAAGAWPAVLCSILTGEIRMSSRALKTLLLGGLLAAATCASQAATFPPKTIYLGTPDGSFYFCDHYTQLHVNKASGLLTGTFDASSCGEFTSPLSGVMGKLKPGLAMQVTLDWNTAYGFEVLMPNAWTLVRPDGTYTSYNVDGVPWYQGVWVETPPAGVAVSRTRLPMPAK
jgi:hypothetical protein